MNYYNILLSKIWIGCQPRLKIPFLSCCRRRDVDRRQQLAGGLKLTWPPALSRHVRRLALPVRSSVSSVRFVRLLTSQTTDTFAISLRCTRVIVTVADDRDELGRVVPEQR